jgi:N-carbamoylputrescine amidase
VCSPNRIGVEKIRNEEGGYVSDDGIQFWGQSFIAEPNGQVLYRASVEKEEVIVREVDLEKVEFSRTHWPFLRDRRIDAYEGITKRYIGS